MSQFNVNDVIAPELEELGFVRAGKEFTGRSGDVMMTVYCNPEPRLKRIQTVTVDCATVDTPSYVEYQFNQRRAATDDRRSYDEPGYPGWPEVMAEHFRRVTVPFIRAATSFDVIVDGLLTGRFPVHWPVPYPGGAIVVAYRIAERLGTTPSATDVLAFAQEQRFDWLEFRYMRDWAVREGVSLELQPPPFSVRGAVDRWLPSRYRLYTPPPRPLTGPDGQHS